MADTENKGKLQKSFEAVGEYRSLEITPTDESNELLIGKTLEVQFGHLSTWREDEDGNVSDEKKAGRFEVTYPRVVDGMEDHIVVMAADAGKAVAQAITQSGRGTPEDYIFDLDDDYFKQKLEAPKENPDDVWNNPKFKDVREELASLAGDTEEALEAMAADQEHAQESAMKVGKVLVQVFDTLKSRKAVANWAKGPGGAGNHPHLAKLGKGANALYEATLIARLTEAQFAVLPASVTSGKGVDTHRARSLADITDGLYVKEMSAAGMWPDGWTTKSGAQLPSVECGAAILRRIATKGFQIENPSDYDLIGLKSEVDSAAARLAGEFIANFGKQVNTYDKEEYTAAKLAFGRVTASEGGDDLFGGAVEALNRVDAAEDDEAARTEMAKLYSNNLMFKKAVDSITAHMKVIGKEAQNREIIKEIVEGDGDGPISQKAAKSFAALPPLAAAAHLFKLLNTHPAASLVWADMRSLVGQQGLSEADDKKDAA